MNSEIFTKRLYLGLSILWLQSDEFRNICKETTFRTLRSVTTVRWIQKYSQRLFLGLCSVIPVRSIQKYSQRDYFSDSVLWFESDEFRNIHKEITFRTLFCDLNWMNEFQKYSQRDYFQDSLFCVAMACMVCSIVWYVQLHHSRHSLSFAC